MLTNDLVLHFLLNYFAILLVFIFSFKLIADKDLYSTKLEFKVKSLPLGKYIHILISKLINSWRLTNIFWFYLIRFMLLVFLSCSAFGVYTSLLALKL